MILTPFGGACNAEDEKDIGGFPSVSDFGYHDRLFGIVPLGSMGMGISHLHAPHKVVLALDTANRQGCVKRFPQGGHAVVYN